MPTDEYRAMDGINFSSLKYGFISQRAMHWAMNKTEADDPPTEAMRFGSLAHMAMLEPDVLAETLVIFAGKRSGDKWAQFQAEHPNQTIVTVSQNKRLMGISRAIHSNPHANRLIEATKHEQVLTWNDTGYKAAKACVDGISDRLLIEFKTTKIESKDAFLRNCVKMQYHHQCSWYQHGAEENGYKDQEVWIIGAMQHKWHDVWVYRVPDQILRDAYKECRRIAVLYRCCEASSWFAGEQEMVEDYSLPTWGGGDSETDISTGTMEVSEL